MMPRSVGQLLQSWKKPSNVIAQVVSELTGLGLYRDVTHVYVCAC
jgi:hypothetical protein